MLKKPKNLTKSIDLMGLIKFYLARKEKMSKRNVALRAFKTLLKDVLNDENGFYKHKNGKVNIAKLSRVSGLSRSFLKKELYIRGLL